MARSTTKRALILEYAAGGVPPTFTEALASQSGTLYPGFLLEWTGGTAVLAHATGTGALGIPNLLMTHPTPDTRTYPTTDSIDIPPAKGDTVYVAQPTSGEVWNLWLAASQTAVAKASHLASNGDGRLRVITPGTETMANAILGVAENSVTTVSGTPARVQVRIL